MMIHVFLLQVSISLLLFWLLLKVLSDFCPERACLTYTVFSYLVEFWMELSEQTTIALSMHSLTVITRWKSRNPAGSLVNSSCPKVVFCQGNLTCGKLLASWTDLGTGEKGSRIIFVFMWILSKRNKLEVNHEFVRLLVITGGNFNALVTKSPKLPGGHQSFLPTITWSTSKLYR